MLYKKDENCIKKPLKVETSLQAGPVDRRGSTGGLKVVAAIPETHR